MPLAKRPPVARVNLEQVYKPRDPSVYGVPLVVLDFRVALHGILQRAYEFAEMTGTVLPMTEPDADGKQWPDTTPLASHKLWPNWIRACWAIKLNRGPDMLPRTPYRVIVVDDNKVQLDDGRTVYWRGLVYSLYKAGRSSETSRDTCYKSIRDIGHVTIAELGFSIYSKPLYEADDWAGVAHRLKLAADRDSLLWSRELYYSTVDSDWLQLVDDESGQLWANTGPWPSRLKNESETRAYVLKRMGVRITKPYEIAAVKQHQGDTADDLPAGSNLSLFDLCNANPCYDLAKSVEASSLLSDLSKAEANTSFKHLQTAVQWCSANGLPVVARP
jgi:hypothetical protein